ncbi:IPT/TIG domain-containing protein [Algoriphagus chordae]|uniref:IPT/TIG domain-containing protein n=1 Tax=Algoriphagus chordae TaxID=237019 RepID=A0A2W7QJN9_9BACT|nr:IPT/TIG domain-containing protein [Algoriphagus chordae]PZX48684.1 hypothetical protein LV85_03498 [Algoriphagus chordae]
MKYLHLLYLALGSILLVACQNDEGFTPRSYPFILTNGVNLIDETGATFDFEIKDWGIGQITSYGIEFLETELADNKYSEGEYYLREIKGKPEGAQVSVKISSDLIDNTEYIAYPFVKTVSSKITGKSIRFRAKGSSNPQILKVTKSTLGLNMSFTITGKDFSSKKEWNQVLVSGTEKYFSYKVSYASTDSLVVGVYPITYWEGSIAEKFDLNVQTHGLTANLPSHFNIEYPRILSISTLEVVPGDEITITTNLENDSQFMYLTVNNIDGWNVNYLTILLEKIENNKYRCIMPEFPAGNYRIGLYSGYEIDETAAGLFHIYFEDNLEVLSK